MEESDRAASVPPPASTPRSTPPPAATAGWYPDPAGSGGARYWDGSGWTDRVTQADTRPEAKPTPDTDPTQSGLRKALWESTAAYLKVEQEQRNRGWRGKTKRGFSSVAVIVFALLVVGWISGSFNGDNTPSATSGFAADPCSTMALDSGKQTLAQYKQACPKWHDYATVTYPKTVPATAPIATGGAIFGGTQGAWNAAYTQDPNVDGGGAFDPSPGSYPDNTDRFTGVSYDNSRVFGMTEALPAGTKIVAAVAAVKKMLPADAKLGHVVVLDNCAALGITSTTLGSEFGSPNAVAFFDSGTAGDHYDPADVGEFSLAAAETVPSSC